MIISIIIATYNAAKTLNRCLDSIVPQLTNETELILVDGGSKDDTNKIIDSCENAWRTCFLLPEESGEERQVVYLNSSLIIQ